MSWDQVKSQSSSRQETVGDSPEAALDEAGEKWGCKDMQEGLMDMPTNRSD